MTTQRCQATQLMCRLRAHVAAERWHAAIESALRGLPPDFGTQIGLTLREILEFFKSLQDLVAALLSSGPTPTSSATAPPTASETPTRTPSPSPTRRTPRASASGTWTSSTSRIGAS